MNAIFINHCGASEVTFNDLSRTPLPEKTKTYAPVGHQDLAANAIQLTSELLEMKGFRLDSQRYSLGKDDQKMFGALTFRHDTDTEKGLAMGLRNSYDMSMTAGFVLGASVFVCDNLAFSGDIRIMRKHTGDVTDHLQKEILKVAYDATSHWVELNKDIDKMRRIRITDDRVATFLGKLFMDKVITPTQLNPILKHWQAPPHEAWEERTAWSLYNGVTEAFKKLPADKQIPRHLSLHEKSMEIFDTFDTPTTLMIPQEITYEAA